MCCVACHDTELCVCVCVTGWLSLQDLPNYAQHQVPIFSLPQEWLWCETWCSMDTKVKAKTIDMVRTLTQPRNLAAASLLLLV